MGVSAVPTALNGVLTTCRKHEMEGCESGAPEPKKKGKLQTGPEHAWHTGQGLLLRVEGTSTARPAQAQRRVEGGEWVEWRVRCVRRPPPPPCLLHL